VSATLPSRFGGICNHEVLATEREPEGQPRRARGDDEASVARSAARGAIGIITRPNIAKRSNHEVLATEREPEGQAKRSNPAANEYKDLQSKIARLQSPTK